MWNPESWVLESGIQLKESRIPPTIEFRNPNSTDKEYRIQYLESRIYGEESRILNSLTWGNASRESGIRKLGKVCLLNPESGKYWERVKASINDFCTELTFNSNSEYPRDLSPLIRCYLSNSLTQTNFKVLRLKSLPRSLLNLVCRKHFCTLERCSTIALENARGTIDSKFH